MLGAKIYKPVENWGEYTKLVQWCNANNATIEEHEEYYEVVEVTGPALEEMKAEKIAAFKAKRNAEEIAPVEWNGNLYDYDADSRDRLSIARQALEDIGQGVIVWTTAENTRVEIGVADFKGINGAAAYRSNLLHVKYNQLKAQVEAVETKEQLAAIEW